MTDGARTTDPSRAEHVLAGLAIVVASVLMLAGMGRAVIPLVLALWASGGWPAAYLATLFLAIGGGIGNGLDHIALAIRANGYFPGLYTASFALAIGIALLERHRRRVERVPAM